MRVESRFTIDQQVRMVHAKDIKATVIGITLNRNGVTYHCVWWHDGNRKDEWLCEFELEACS